VATALGLPRLEKTPALWQNILPVLRYAILSGRLAPGTRLVPENLARELGVSRGPVRDALRQLQEEGLIVIASNGRPFVQGLSRRYVHDLYAFRASMDLLAIRTALTRPDAINLESLESMVEAMRDSLARGDAEGLADADVSFHQRIIALAENAVMENVWRNLADFSRTLLLVTDQLKTSEPSVADIHAAIVAALAARDLAVVEEAVAAHYRYGEDLLVASSLVRL